MYIQRYRKYKAKKTTYNGYKYDSKFEASVARDLDIRIKAGEIMAYDRQFKTECIPYNCHGEKLPTLKVSYKVDFRVHENDGSFTLLEAKGYETQDFRRRRKWLEKVWLPENLDHSYMVVKQK